MKPYDQTVAEATGKAFKKPKRPAKDSREEWIERACTAFEHYKKKKFYIDYSGEIYKFLKFEGLINFTTERKNTIAVDYITTTVDSLTARLKSTSNEAEKKMYQKRIDKLISGEENITLKLKQAALQIFFKDCIETDTDLLTALTEKI